MPNHETSSIEAAGKVALALREAEDDTDRTMAAVAELARLMSTVRIDINLSALFGQSAFEHVATAYAAGAEARKALGLAHRDLEKVARNIGLRTVDFGPLSKPSPDEITAVPALKAIEGGARVG